MERNGVFGNVTPVAILHFELSREQSTNPIEKSATDLAIGKQGRCFVIGTLYRKKPSGKPLSMPNLRSTPTRISDA